MMRTDDLKSLMLKEILNVCGCLSSVTWKILLLEYVCVYSDTKECLIPLLPSVSTTGRSAVFLMMMTVKYVSVCKQILDQ